MRNWKKKTKRKKGIKKLTSQRLFDDKASQVLDHAAVLVREI